MRELGTRNLNGNSRLVDIAGVHVVAVQRADGQQQRSSDASARHAEAASGLARSVSSQLRRAYSVAGKQEHVVSVVQRDHFRMRQCVSGRAKGGAVTLI